MPPTPRTSCEQCLRDTTGQGECERHPFSRQLSMAHPADREHYALMRRLQLRRRIPGLLVLLYALLLLGLTWFFGVLGRDLMIGIQRMIWGIRIEQVPDMLTAPIEDPDPILSAEEARVRRQVHREARVTAGYGRFKL